jgi:primosomal protein N' (replication factor Y)
MDGKAAAALLSGVTGSGKTLVYIKLISLAAKMGKGAIFLVPEIALTPQMLRQFYAHFPGRVAVVHSGLTHAQRYDEYKRIRLGHADIVVGTRTGILAPVKNLGLIIVDEEQEYTYKAENPPRYHARDVAKYRAVRHGALVVLGSATPSVESYYYAAAGRYSLFTIPERYGSIPLPRTVIADMRKTLRDGDGDQVGPELLGELRANLSRGEQSILFLNRRGSAKMAICIKCGEAPGCVNCSVALTYHSRNGRLMCHHCGHSREMPKVCPVCGSEHMRLIGSGTQRIEEELRQRLPEAAVLRMDADTVSGRQTHESLLDRFAEGKADILVGTQMVSKGLDFDNVTLVGVLDADLSLYCGDYHSQERTFSLIAQVVGRAGRRQKPGRAVIQTFTPENPVILAAAGQNYQNFYRYEIESRKAILAPPFCDIFVFTLSAIRENDALGASLALSGILTRFFGNDFSDIKTRILGPVSAPIARLNKFYRYTVSVRGKDGKRFRELISKTLVLFAKTPQARRASVFADMNPIY